MAILTALALLWSLTSPDRVEAPADRAYSAFSPDPARRFDFWIGEWDVNLRMLQADGSFRDSVAAEASIYSILDGKAVLELWDSGPIKGFSLRYYDPDDREWELWLDWPQPNRSGLSNLTGSFRHGRGEFTRTTTDAEGNERIAVYSFDDITPFSLRWDDRYSTDGGKTWTLNWIMEFTRTSVDPRWPSWPDAVPTYVDDSRCTDERFRQHELLVGNWEGDGVSLEVTKVLDGCAVVGFLEYENGPDEFVFLTFDSSEERWVTAVLDDVPGTGLALYSGAEGWVSLVADEGGSLGWTVSHRGGGLGQPGDQLTYRRDERILTLTRPGSG